MSKAPSWWLMMTGRVFVHPNQTNQQHVVSSHWWVLRHTATHPCVLAAAFGRSAAARWHRPSPANCMCVGVFLQAPLHYVACGDFREMMLRANCLHPANRGGIAGFYKDKEHLLRKYRLQLCTEHDGVRWGTTGVSQPARRSRRRVEQLRRRSLAKTR